MPVAALKEQTVTQPSTACDHCGLPVPKGLIEPAAERQFCCNGCRTVYDMIHANGLDRYYRLRESVAAKPRRGSATRERYAAFDSEQFLASQTRETATGRRVADLRLEGVHCAACLWLVERLPDVLPGVAEARLSLRASLVRVTWDPAAVPLSKVAQTLDRLGYPSHAAAGVSSEEVRRQEERRQMVRLGVAGALAANSMLLALALYAGLFSGIEAHFQLLFRWVSAGLGLASLAWPGAIFFRGAWASLRTRRPSLDLPIALALSVGGAAGLVNTVLNRGDIYFDSLSVLVFLLLVGRWFQARQQRRADEAVNLMFSFAPSSCRVVQGDEVVQRPSDSLVFGELVEVRSGDLIPADGAVEEGESSINQALLTGESRPVAVGVGDKVFAGAQNLGGVLRVRVLAAGEESRVGGLMRLVDQGVREKPPIVQFADRVAGWFVAVVAGLSLVTLAGWWAHAGGAVAVDHTVALLIVACPCALGLATPLTMAMALGSAARRNMLVKDARAIERLATSGRLLLDKTGTITAGRPSVVQWIGPDWLKEVVAGAEHDSQHPVGVALRQAFESDDEGQGGPPLSDIQERGDGGLTAEHGGKRLSIGAPSYFRRRGISIGDLWKDTVYEHQALGQTVVLIAVDDQFLGLAALADQTRPDAGEALRQLAELGWEPSILSGDAPEVVKLVAQQVGVPNERAHPIMTPEAKLGIVRQRDDQRGPTVMVGDGVNDAAALAAADVGVAVHGGVEASLAAADVYLAEDGLAPLVELTRLSRRAMQVVRRNLAISLTYNVVAVSLAAAGLITPLVAAVLMPISSATVLASAAAGLRGGRW
ncbi:putative copper-importing P-type ATPase A [Posidoniimonas polymericola]|uniref:Putative copper-importing P-type ATPase A n=1 Tax=Posidoniimonas polymericola TaxID=2528002 RepID=A0A5C5XY39_9BACT|nr:heavy metal translocating P-type ATPase [Posidoniimonas polymericola]TWT66835.1 putative copper-importing P-type ATPase A [Posidoniimonas polymericola]